MARKIWLQIKSTNNTNNTNNSTTNNLETGSETSMNVQIIWKLVKNADADSIGLTFSKLRGHIDVAGLGLSYKHQGLTCTMCQELYARLICQGYIHDLVESSQEPMTTTFISM